MKRILLSLIVIGLFGVGCTDVIVEPITIGIPSSPTNCAFNLELSFNYRDIQLYKQILSPNFTFIFNPNDVGKEVNGYIIPETWGYEDDWAAMQNMFNEAYDISFQINENDIGDPAEGATEYLAEDIPISLLVMIDSDNGFLAQGTCDFAFETYDSNGKIYWRIRDWWDGTSDGGDEGGTIGWIKAYFKDGKPGRHI